MAYSVTNKNSFENINMWYKELINSSVHNIDIILLGNKIDLEFQREVSTEEGENLKNKLNLKKFVKCSAKNDFNVPGIFFLAANYFMINIFLIIVMGKI